MRTTYTVFGTTLMPWKGDLFLPETFTARTDEADAFAAGYVVEAVVEVRDGEPRMTKITVASREGEALEARSLRQISIPGIVDRASLAVAVRATPVPGGLSYEPAYEVGEVLAASPRRPPGRPALDDDHYLAVVASYRTAEARGIERRSDVIRAIARDPRWGRAVPEKTAARWVRSARDKGFFTGPRRKKGRSS